MILEVKVRYKRELRLRQNAVIETQMINYLRKIATVIQEMKDENGNVCCVIELKAGLFDLKTRRLIAPTAEWIAAWGMKTGHASGDAI